MNDDRNIRKPELADGSTADTEGHVMAQQQPGRPRIDKPELGDLDVAGHVIAVQQPGRPRVRGGGFDGDAEGHVLAVQRPGRPRIFRP